MKNIESRGFTILKQYYSNSASEVYLVKKDNENYVCKKLLYIDIFIKEFDMLNNFNHKGICKIQDIFINDNYYYFIFEYYGEDFFQLLSDKLYKSIYEVSTKLKKKWIFQLIDIISYIHSKDIVYQDLKPHNIILNDNDDIILIDFGLSQYDKLQTILSKNNIEFYPPEFHQEYKTKFVEKSTDIWMLGNIFNYIRPPMQNNFLNILIEDMMKENSEDRITILDVIESDYFKQNYNKEDLMIYKKKDIIKNESKGCIFVDEENGVNIGMLKILNNWIKDLIFRQLKIDTINRDLINNKYLKLFNTFKNNINDNLKIDKINLQLFGASLFYICFSIYHNKLYKYNFIYELCAKQYNDKEISNMINNIILMIFKNRNLFYD